MKIKVSEATDQVLDWLVAKAEGHEVAVSEGSLLVTIRRRNVVGYFDPSGNWGWGGPIKEREGIATRQHSNGTWYAMRSLDLGDGERAQWAEYRWRKSGQVLVRFMGPTELTAAMRCFVASKLGDEVEVPEELMS